MKTNKRFVLADAGSAEDSNLSLKPTHEEISVVAHQIYEEESCPGGPADSHWHAAKVFLDREA
jgi:hypothetical protein